MNRSSLFDSSYNSFSQHKVIVSPIDREKGMTYVWKTIINYSVNEMKKQIEKGTLYSSKWFEKDSTILLPTIAITICSLLVFLRK